MESINRKMPVPKLVDSKTTGMKNDFSTTKNETEGETNHDLGLVPLPKKIETDNEQHSPELSIENENNNSDTSQGCEDNENITMESLPTHAPGVKKVPTEKVTTFDIETCSKSKKSFLSATKGN